MTLYLSSIWFYIIISESISVCLIYRLWKKDDVFFLKLLASLIALIPFFGPFLYFFATDETPAMDSELQNRHARGGYTDFWISNRSSIKKRIKELEKEIESQEK